MNRAVPSGDSVRWRALETSSAAPRRRTAGRGRSFMGTGTCRALRSDQLERAIDAGSLIAGTDLFVGALRPVAKSGWSFPHRIRRRLP